MVAAAIVYVPDARQVYGQVARVLRSGGSYRSDWGQPAIHFAKWDGKGYSISRPYSEREERREDGGIEFRHYLDDILNGLLETGFSIRQVLDLSRERSPDPEAEPGSWNHQASYVGGHFTVIAQMGPHARPTRHTPEGLQPLVIPSVATRHGQRRRNGPSSD